MALFSKSKKEEKKDTAKPEKESKVSKEETKEVVETEAEAVATPGSAKLSDVIISPRITEKTVKLMDKGVYTFNVRKDANKTEVAKAIKLIFKVEPLSVNIVNFPGKRKRNNRTGKMGKKSGGKKAIVYLKEGDKISLI